MAQAWYQYGVTQAYTGNSNGGEMGVDLGTPFGTIVTALYAGTVRWAGRTQWSCGSSGGEVTIVCNVPGYGVMTSYYLHLDTATVKTGDTVHQGQVIGTTGGQLSGGHWPVVNCPQKGLMYSSGPHIEFGFNAPWVSGPGKNVNPMFAITQARNGTLPNTSPDGTASPASTTPGDAPAPGAGAGDVPAVINPTLVQASLLAYSNVTTQTHRAVMRPNGFDGICETVNDLEQWADWNGYNFIGSLMADFQPFLVRMFFFSIAFFIILMVLGDLIKGQIETGLRIAGAVAAPEVAAGSAVASGLSQAPQDTAR